MRHHPKKLVEGFLFYVFAAYSCLEHCKKQKRDDFQRHGNKVDYIKITKNLM
jgi:hypothetical protein